MRYDVDALRLEGRAGILTQGRQPVKRSLATLAEKQAEGFKIRVTRDAQKRIGGKLSKKFGRVLKSGLGGKLSKKYRNIAATAASGSVVPKVGVHHSAPRPIAHVVFQRERQTIITNIKRNFGIKFNGGRY
jgi:hypothetical protein